MTLIQVALGLEGHGASRRSDEDCMVGGTLASGGLVTSTLLCREPESKLRGPAGPSK